MSSCPTAASALSNGPRLKDRTMRLLHTKGTTCSAPAWCQSAQKKRAFSAIGLFSRVSRGKGCENWSEKNRARPLAGRSDQTQTDAPFYSCSPRLLLPKCFF